MKLASWLVLVLGWTLLLKGYTLPGVFALAAFAVLRIQGHRQRTQFPARVSAATPARMPAPVPADTNPTVPPVARIRIGEPQARWRRMVLASYGNAYLRDALALEHWHRHRALWDAVSTFRESADSRLLAGNGVAWLQWIKLRGATHISLCMTEELPVIASIDHWDRQALRVDFPESHEIWMAGRESAVCDASVDAALGNSYEPASDAYWRTQTCSGSNPPTLLDWDQMRSYVQETLRSGRVFEIDTNLSSEGFTPLKAYFAHCPDWADLPLLPADEKLAIPHELLRDLSRIQSSLENFCHPKNDASSYHSFSGDDQLRIDSFRNTLQRLIEEVQCAAGSETRWTGAGGTLQNRHE